MEESKELQGFYKIFRAVIYVSILMEFFAYALEPEQLDFLGGVVTDIHGRIKRWMIYHDGNLVYSKVATFLLICITCVGTRNKKHLEFDARRQVLYPLLSGVLLIVLSVWLFGHSIMLRFYTLRLNTWLYMLTSIVGVVLVHIALDNISKFLKEGLLKDRFNFENESFEQCRELQENKYSVNIPMRYYYKGKFRKGWVNIVNPFRGTWVVGTPGSGKTFSIIEPFIRQHSEKGFAMVVYRDVQIRVFLVKGCIRQFGAFFFNGGFLLRTEGAFVFLHQFGIVDCRNAYRTHTVICTIGRFNVKDYVDCHIVSLPSKADYRLIIPQRNGKVNRQKENNRHCCRLPFIMLRFTQSYSKPVYPRTMTAYRQIINYGVAHEYDFCA